MMTTTELDMVEYLMQQPVVANNTVTVNRGIVKQTLTFLLENKIEVLGLSCLSISDDSISKLEDASISYEKEKSLENMLQDIEKVSGEFSHIEISVLLKDKK